MKMNELPSGANWQSMELNAKGKSVVLECYPDGEIFFWTDDGVCLEFDGRNTALIAAALKQQEKLPKTSRPAPAPLAAVPRQLRPLAAAASLRPVPGQELMRRKQPNRSVARDERGWGATVVVAGAPTRYYYDKRDNARAANPEHKVGEAGRLA